MVTNSSIIEYKKAAAADGFSCSFEATAAIENDDEKFKQHHAMFSGRLSLAA